MKEKSAPTGTNPPSYPPYEVPANFALFGNGKNTLFPIVDPQTGEEMPIFSKEYFLALIKKYPDLFKEISKILDFLHDITSLKLRDLPHVSSRPVKYETIRMETRKKILDSADNDPHSPLWFLADHPRDYRNNVLKRLANTADEYIQSTIKRHLPGHEHSISLREEVKNCNDLADLIFMALDSKWDLQIRHEAKRKIALMILLGELETVGQLEESDNDPLGYFTSILDNHLILNEPETKKGTAEKCVLISRHEHKDKKVKSAEVIPENNLEETPLGPNDKATPISLRISKALNAEGKNIRFYVDSRQKNLFLRIVRLMRGNKQIGDTKKVESDLNGIRLMFETKEEWEIFYEAMIKAIKKTIKDEAGKRLYDEEHGKTPDESTLNRIRDFLENINQKVFRYDDKGDIEGKTTFEGASSASSTKLRILKFKLKILRLDRNNQEQEMVYELQAFLPHTYAEYLYGDGVGWYQYNIDRFFTPSKDKDDGKEYCSVAQLLFPPQIYPELDFEAARIDASAKAYYQIWHQAPITKVRSVTAKRVGAAVKK